MIDLDQFKRTYFEECSELLSELEDQFQRIENGARDSQALQAVFRAVHSIKGGAGAFGFTDLVEFTHSFETLLDLARSQDLELTADVVGICLKAVDATADLVVSARTGTKNNDRDFADLKSAIFAICNSGPVRKEEKEPAETGSGGHSEAESGGWRVIFAPKPVLFERGNEPLLLLRALNLLAEIEPVATVTDLPPLSDIDIMAPYVGWEITLPAWVDRDEIEEVFDFVEGECFLQISEFQADDTGDDSAAEEKTAPDGEAPSAGAAEPDAGQDPAALQSVRVDLEKVDRVVDMVGEIVITQSMLTAQLDDTLRETRPDLVRGLEIMAQHTRDLQDSVMAIRAQPVRSIFARMKRVLRELSEKTGKPLKLEMSGEATEVDRTIVERLAEPLTHMIRNSADHGIEDAQTRAALGKPPVGTIRLDARQRSGRIIISISDDGGGIDRDLVLARARQKGLVSENTLLTDAQTDALIFEPGFSTSDTVSDLSGRGVGLDVVVQNIRQVGGVVSVRSVAGEGTEVTLALPLTLAILDVMLVEAGGVDHVLPISNIIESMQCSLARFGILPSGERMLRVRGEYIRVVDVCEAFHHPSVREDRYRFVILCETEGDGRVALIVDNIVGQQQVVIKSIEQNFGRLNGISGATILGNGQVALILDVPELVELGSRSSTYPPAGLTASGAA